MLAQNLAANFEETATDTNKSRQETAQPATLIYVIQQRQHAVEQVKFHEQSVAYAGVIGFLAQQFCR